MRLYPSKAMTSRANRAWLAADSPLQPGNVCFGWRSQSVDATHALNLSAGVSVPGIRDVTQLFAIYRHAVALYGREQAHADLLPHPHDPVNCRWIAQQFYRFESATFYIRQVPLVAVVTVTVQLIQPDL